MVDRMSLKDLSEAERRGAMLALDHVRRLGLRMETNARSSALHAASKAERDLLATAGKMVRNTAHIVRRELSPDLQDHHYR